MYIRSISSIIRGPEDGKGSSSGGGAEIGNDKPRNNGVPSVGNQSEEGELESGEPDADDGDSSLYNLYHGRDKGGRGRKSAIEDRLIEGESGEGESEEEDSSSEKEGSGSPKKKEAAKQQRPLDELTDEELLEIDPDKVVSATTGRPLSIESSKFINTLKKKLKDATEKLSKVPDASKLTETPEYKELQDKYEKTKKELDTKYFEESEGFKETYIAPLNSAAASVESYFKDLEPSSRGEVQELMKEAASFAGKGDRRGFAQVLDKLDDVIEGGSGTKTMFAQDMQSWFNAFSAYTKGFSLSETERKKHIEKTLSERRKSNSMSFESDVDDSMEKFEVEKSVVIESLPEDIRKKYVGAYKGNADAVKKSLTEFSVTGKMTDDLKNIIRKGIYHDSIIQENEIAWAGYRDMAAKSKLMESQLNEMKKKLAKFTKEPSEDNSERYQTRPIKEKAKSKNTSIISGFLKELADED